MRVLILLLFCVTCQIMTQGGIKMRVGQHGLNAVMEYLLEEELIPYLQDIDLGEHILKFGSAKLHINKLAVGNLVGQHGSVDITSGNKIALTAGFGELAMTGNLTYTGPEVLYGPDTVVHFKDCRLDVTFLLGTGGNAEGVELESCKATIGSFEAEGALKRALAGAFELGQGKFASLVEEICPYLENITNESLDDILSVEDTVAITSETIGDISINVRLLSTSTEDDYISVEVERTYSVEVDKSSIINRVSSSGDGASVIWNATFNVRNTEPSNTCGTYKIRMDSVIPFVFGYNDEKIVASVDPERLQMAYSVSSWNESCIEATGQTPVSSTIEAQKTVLKETNEKMEAQLLGKSFSMKLPTGKWYGFKKAHVKTLSGGLALTFGLRVGQENQQPTESLETNHNMHYNKKVISYTYTNGETEILEVGVVPPEINATSSTLPSITLTFFLVILMVLSE